MPAESDPLQLTFDPEQAKVAGERGQQLALDADRVQLWRNAADAWLADLPHGLLITADDLVRDIGLPDEGVDRNNAVGAWFGRHARAGHLYWTGRLEKSTRVVRHGNLQRLWKVTHAAQLTLGEDAQADGRAVASVE